MQLWLVRHAQPLVQAGVCYGALDLQADAQATHECAESLAAALPPGAEIHTSPLQRCEQLRKVLLGLRGDLASKTDPRLAEMAFGDWEGQTWDAIGQPAIDAWVANFGQYRPGGGESAQAVLQRVGAALQDAQAQAKDTVWLTHAGVIRAAKLWLTGVRDVPQAAAWPTQAPAFGQWQVVDL